MYDRDVFAQTLPSQTLLQDGTSTAGNWATGITNDYRSYNPANSKFANVATTRASVVDPQRGIANFYGAGRYSSALHWLSNSAQVTTATANRITYLAPSVSRPANYYWEQNYGYSDPVKAAFANQTAYGLGFYRLSNGGNVVLDQLKIDSSHWLYYNLISHDNNLLTISNSGVVSKIESTDYYNDNITNPSTPLIWQTHGGIPTDATNTWRTDYSRDSFWQANDKDTYVWYRPNYGGNVQIPESVETMGEWYSNRTGGRGGSKRKKKIKSIKKLMN